MLKRTISLFSVALALAVTPLALHAQASTPLSASSRPIYDAVTVAGALCGLSGAANPQQARNPPWRRRSGPARRRSRRGSGLRLQVRPLRVRQDAARHRLAGRPHAVLLDVVHPSGWERPTRSGESAPAVRPPRNLSRT